MMNVRVGIALCLYLESDYLLNTKDFINTVQCSPPNLNFRGPIKFVQIMRCSNYEFACE